MSNFIPYGKQSIDEDDIEAVINILKSDYLTTGPVIDQFEEAMANYTGKKYAVAVSNGTAALHTAVFGAGIGKDDEVIVADISFVASSNCVLYEGGTVVFADVEEDTLNIDPNKIEGLITNKTKAIIAVDMAGQLCDYTRLREICKKHNLILIEDAAHSLGADNCGYGDLTTLSFHPVKNMTTGEGGMILTDNVEYYNRMKAFRTHGIYIDYKMREKLGSYFYDMIHNGYNYRLTDFQSALGLSQLKKLDGFITRRKEIAAIYDNALKAYSSYLEPIVQKQDSGHHIYIIKLKEGIDRDTFFKELKSRGIGVNVHYRPIHLHTYYKNLNMNVSCPVAESVYNRIITIPIYPKMTDADVEYVVSMIGETCNAHMI